MQLFSREAAEVTKAIRHASRANCYAEC